MEIFCNVFWVDTTLLEVKTPELPQPRVKLSYQELQGLYGLQFTEQVESLFNFPDLKHFKPQSAKNHTDNLK